MKLIAILFALGCPILAFGTDSLKLDLVASDGVLRLLLVNQGEVEATISARMALAGGENGPNEVSLVVIGASGERYPFLPEVRVGAPRTGDFRRLLPGQIVGRDYEVLRIKEEFGLPKGDYRVRAVYYLDKTGGGNLFRRSIMSNEVVMHVND